MYNGMNDTHKLGIYLQSLDDSPPGWKESHYTTALPDFYEQKGIK